MYFYSALMLWCHFRRFTTAGWWKQPNNFKGGAAASWTQSQSLYCWQIFCCFADVAVKKEQLWFCSVSRVFRDIWRGPRVCPACFASAVFLPLVVCKRRVYKKFISSACWDQIWELMMTAFNQVINFTKFTLFNYQETLLSAVDHGWEIIGG